MNSMPTHAFSNVNQVANAYAGNPQALQQRTNPPANSGIKPELIDLIALQKIQAQQKAYAGQIAMQAGMNQPTVADSLKQQVVNTEKQSLIDEASKNAGLPALMSRPTAGAAPQQPAQQPEPVQAAEGGLMRLPTNLPNRYANGGIIAFAGDDPEVGSQVPEPHESEMMRAIKAPFRATGKFLADTYTEKGSEEKQRVNALIEKARLEKAALDAAEKEKKVSSGPSVSKDADMSAYKPRNPVASSPDLSELFRVIVGIESGGDEKAVSKQGARGAVQIMPDTFKQYAKPGESIENAEHRRAVAYRKLMDDFNYYGGDIDKTAAAYIGGRGAVRDGNIRDDVRDANGTSPLAYAQMVRNRMGRGDLQQNVATAPTQAKPASGLEAVLDTFATNRLTRDPAKERDLEEERYKKTTAPAYEQAMAEQKAGLARLQQLQEQARQNRPNDWMAMLSQISRNGGFAGSGLAGVLTGVGDAPARARAAAIQQDMDYETQVQALRKQMTDAMAARDKGAYDAALGMMKEIEKGQDHAATTGASLVNSKAAAEANRLKAGELNLSHAASLEETKRKNFLAALNVVNDNYSKDIAAIEQKLQFMTEDSKYKRALEADLNAKKALRDRDLRDVYKQYGMPIGSSQQSASAAPTGKVFSYNTGKPI